MEQSAEQIAKSIRQKGWTGPDNGLMIGKTGLIIFYYHLARTTNNPDYEKTADELLESVYANISTSSTVDFGNGLSGIGWGIEYLVQNHFAEGDTDQILEEVDNKIFRFLNEETHVSFELDTGLTGILFYLISRLKKRKEPLSMAQQINRELFFLIINKIDECVTAQFPDMVKELHFDLFWRFPAVLFGLTEAFKLRIYNNKISNMIRQWLPYLEAYMPSLQINRLFLAIILQKINSLMPDKQLEKRARILLFATDFEILKTEVDHRVINIRYGVTGLLWLLHIAMKELPSDWINYPLIGTTYRVILKSNQSAISNWSFDIPDGRKMASGLTVGFAGVRLLDMLWPEVLSGTGSF